MDGVQRQHWVEIMVNRLLFGLTFAAVGALSYGWYYNNQRIISAHQEKVESFMKAGPRFTAKDGQELCLRIQRLEHASYGFRDLGYVSLGCDYGER